MFSIEVGEFELQMLIFILNGPKLIFLINIVEHLYRTCMFLRFLTHDSKINFSPLNGSLGGTFVYIFLDFCKLGLAFVS